MKAEATFRGFDIAGDIRFHGDTSEDEKVVKKIRELHDFIFDIFEQVEVAENQVSNRQEISAVKIDAEIRKMKESLKLTFFEGDSQ